MEVWMFTIFIFFFLFSFLCLFMCMCLLSYSTLFSYQPVAAPLARARAPALNLPFSVSWEPRHGYAPWGFFLSSSSSSFSHIYTRPPFRTWIVRASTNTDKEN